MDDEITKVHLSETMVQRIKKFDEALRKGGFLHFSAPSVLECPEFIKLIVYARGEDYQAGAKGRVPSTQMLAVRILPVIPTPPDEDK